MKGSAPAGVQWPLHVRAASQRWAFPVPAHSVLTQSFEAGPVGIGLLQVGKLRRSHWLMMLSQEVATLPRSVRSRAGGQEGPRKEQ